VQSLPALRPWAPPAERGPSLESIYRTSLAVDLWEGNKIIGLEQFISPQPAGGPSKRKKNPGPCPMSPFVKTALATLSVGAVQPGLRVPPTVTYLPYRVSGSTLTAVGRSVAGPTVWNSLPDFIRDPTSSTDCFMRLLTTYLFARYQCIQRIRGS